MKRANVAAFASGMTGCGKSQLLWDLYASRHPRVISYDPVGDTMDRNPAAIAVGTARELWAHLRKVSAQRADTWHFVMYGSAVEMLSIMDTLLPPNIAPNAPTLSRALGGVLFETGELDTLAGNAATPQSVAFREKWQRGRHGLLSFAVATQAPALVSRIVTGNSHELYIFGHSEHTSVKYFRDQIGDRAAEAIARLPQYEYLHYRKGDAFAVHYKTRMRGALIERKPFAEVPLLLTAD